MKYALRITLAITLTMLLQINSGLASEIELNEQTISAWINSQSALEEWGKKHHAQLEENNSSSSTSSPTSMTPESMVEPLKAAGLYQSANKLIKTQGFPSIDDWAKVTLRITKAAAALEIEANPELMDNSKLEELRSTENIDEKQKQILTNAIEKNIAIVNDILSNTSQTDKDAIKPFLNKILEMMEEPY